MSGPVLYPVPDPVPDKAASRLANPLWRIWHSLWIAPVVAGGGLFSFVGFAYVGLRARTAKMWAAAAVGCAGSAALWSMWLFTSGRFFGPRLVIHGAVWAAMTGYAFVVDRGYLRWRASLTKADAWYRQPVAAPLPAAAFAQLPPAEQARLAMAAVHQRTTGTVHPVVAAQVARVIWSVDQILPRLADLGALESRTVVATATSYLPEAVDTYLRLPRAYAETHEVSPGKTPAALLVDQLDLLATTLGQISDALSHRDTDALVVHGAFLAEKFGTSHALTLSTPDEARAAPAPAEPVRAEPAPSPQTLTQPQTPPGLTQPG